MNAPTTINNGAAAFSEEEVHTLLENIDKFSDAEVVEVNKLVDELQRRKYVEMCRLDLIEYCKHMQPDYLVGKHHRLLADELMAIERGEKDRICVNIPPRHGKSQMVSVHFPAWFLGRNPGKKIMMVSHTTDLAVDFGRKVRNAISEDAYKEVFPAVTLSKDSKSAGRWNTNYQGEFYACGIGSSIAGRGADLLLVDDPHSEQDVLNGNFSVFDKAYDWFTFGARTRLMPGGRIAIVQTRWHLDDLSGRVTKDMAINPGSDQYEVVEFPAILETEDPKTGKIIEKPLWPEFFDLEALHRTKATMPTYQWNSQYQQNPTAEEAAIVKREWWQYWTKERPPQCDYVIMALDAAAEANTRADFTSITTWGVFKNEETNCYNIILLHAVKERLEFPELKKIAMQEVAKHQPDAFIVEKKSSGTALYQELRRAGIPVQEYTPHRGSGDKTARLNAVADIIMSALVWVPPTRWAEDLVEEVAGFPFMRHDDQVDTCIMALMRFRQGGFITLPTDDWGESDDDRSYRKHGGYY